MSRQLCMWIYLVGILCTLNCCGGATVIPAMQDSKAQMPLDSWLNVRVPEIVNEYLNKSSNFSATNYNKRNRFIIVKAKGEEVVSKVDPLTKDISERFESEFLRKPDSGLVRRDPPASFNRPYTIQEIRCPAFQDFNMLLGINVEHEESEGGLKARIRMRLVSTETGSWVSGFSIDELVALSHQQSRKLDGDPQPDRKLLGLKYSPFMNNQTNEMAKYIAMNLQCKVFQGTGASSVSFCVDYEGAGDRYLLNLIAEELKLGGYKDTGICDGGVKKADYVLRSSLSTADGLNRFFVHLNAQEKGLNDVSTDAYYEFKGAWIKGKWEISKSKDKTKLGRISIELNPDNKPFANFYDNAGTLSSSGISIVTSEHTVAWIYTDLSGCLVLFRGVFAENDIRGQLRRDKEFIDVTIVRKD